MSVTVGVLMILASAVALFTTLVALVHLSGIMRPGAALF
jgi:hypothetical protein